MQMKTSHHRGNPRVLPAAWALIGVTLLLAGASEALAQPVINPTRVEFEASVDHDVMLQPANVPALDRYDLGIFLQGVDPIAGQPFQTSDLGRPPLPPVGRTLSVDRAVMLLALPLGNNYFATVASLGPGGSMRSPASNLFTRANAPAAAANVWLPPPDPAPPPPCGPPPSANEIVIYPGEVAAVAGNWARGADPAAAGGVTVYSRDFGWSTTAYPLAKPSHYVEVTFTAEATKTYRVWLRMRAENDSRWNDSVWVQFSDAVDAGGSPLWRTGTTSGLMVNLESCSGCGVSAWGWQDRAWWYGQTALVRFPTAGTHTMRIQTREDGVTIDQIVLSAERFLNAAPGPVRNDTTILPRVP